MKYLFTFAALCSLTFAGNAFSQETTSPKPRQTVSVQLPAAASQDRPKNFGMGLDLGIPSGAAIGFVVKPNVKWLRLELAGTYNGLAPGIRGGFTLDPINFIIVPTFTFEAGHSFMGTIPSKSAKLDMTYVNFHLGLEVGSQKTFRFFVHGGPSYFVANGSNIESLFGTNQANVQLNNTSIHGWFTPTATMGFVYLF